MAFKKDTKINNDFSKVIVTLSSPDLILDNSNGEVTKPETINYRNYVCIMPKTSALNK